MSVEAVANDVEWSASKLIRIEGGQVGISVSDLNALLGVYGVKDRREQEDLRALARGSRQRTWWSTYQRYLPAPYQEFIGAESDASRIRHYHPTAVPGLLQTAAYATALIEATSTDPLPPAVANARLEVRMLRQQQVLDRPDPPDYTVILDEAVLRRPVGGQETMRQQLDHLIEFAERDTVTVIVVPFAAGPHLGLMGAFALMQYDDPIDDVLCLELAGEDAMFRERPDLITQYHRAADQLETIGLPEPEAIKFVRKVRDGRA
jgi:hypothetical protein